VDLTFPHHENEAAQTRGARGAELARIWMHNGMLQLGGEKMAKSVGNIARLSEVLDEHGRDALIMFLSGGHYRQPIQFDDTTMAQSAASVRRVRELGRRLTDGPSPRDMGDHGDRFFAALADDFNTAQALASAFEWIREANRRLDAGTPVGSDDLHEMLAVLGLANLLEADGDGGTPDAFARELLERREAARSGRDFAEADRLRDELAALGWQVRDSTAGPQLVRADP
jgi:cysteinyl-tRNA synthetase